MLPRLAILVLTVLLAVTLVAAAPPKEAKKDTVEVAVVAILATEGNDKIDPKLACIARQVRKSHKELKGFRIGRMARESLTIGVKNDFEIVEKQKVGVTVVHGADEKDRVQVKVGPPGMGEITYDTCCGKFLPIVTEFRTKDKELLIVAVCVKPCNGK